MSNNNNDLRFRSSIRVSPRRCAVISRTKAREHVEERSELVGKLESSQQELSELKAKLVQAERSAKQECGSRGQSLNLNNCEPNWTGLQHQCGPCREMYFFEPGAR